MAFKDELEKRLAHFSAVLFGGGKHSKKEIYTIIGVVRDSANWAHGETKREIAGLTRRLDLLQSDILNCLNNDAPATAQCLLKEAVETIKKFNADNDGVTSE